MAKLAEYHKYYLLK